ncbi:hypothetical protein CBR_g31939 [Chara braunii]|uniref:Uncharacterized protein n=1 Tax=Chara braunii TaxID=69332 RepID=A0A388LG73_CHABU|nr:hypothetical protein CBR_g31939 [Chara braunii]|eukprot:GBG81267.1 hypothetical protein CBR_g31939 [Chara braunii]
MLWTSQTARCSPFRKRGSQPFAEPPSAECIHCHALVSSHHMHRQSILEATSSPAYDDIRQKNEACASFARLTDDPFQVHMTSRKMLAMPLRLLPSLSTLPVILYLVQTHHWAHTGSCFKNTRVNMNAEVCRYQFPSSQCEQTILRESGVELKRDLDDEYINAYNDVMLSTFKCNHDIQPLFGGVEAADRVFYCCRYATKDQHKVDCKIKLRLAAFDACCECERITEEHTEMPAGAKTRRRLSSQLFSITNKQETAGPLCALYLLRWPCSYLSHDFRVLHVFHMLKQLQNDPDTLYSVEKANSDYVIKRPLDDYVFWPLALTHLSLYEFTMHFYTCDRSTAATSDGNFLEIHPLYTRKTLARWRLPVVPVVPDFARIPDLRACADEDARTLHAQLSLLLFKPFRILTDLVAVGNTWHEAFLSFYEDMPAFVCGIYLQMQDYHIARERAADVRSQRPAEQTDDNLCSNSSDEVSNDSSNAYVPPCPPSDDDSLNGAAPNPDHDGANKPMIADNLTTPWAVSGLPSEQMTSSAAITLDMYKDMAPDDSSSAGCFLRQTIDDLDAVHPWTKTPPSLVNDADATPSGWHHLPRPTRI